MRIYVPAFTVSSSHLYFWAAASFVHPKSFFLALITKFTFDYDALHLFTIAHNKDWIHMDNAGYLSILKDRIHSHLPTICSH